MFALARWSFRTLAATALTAVVAASGSAQVVQPRVKPGVPVVPVNPQPRVVAQPQVGGQAPPRFNALPQPRPRVTQPNQPVPQNPIRVMPQINGLPGFPAYPPAQPAFPSLWAPPGVANPAFPPFMLRPQANPFVNPLLPFNNPLINNNPFLPFNNPLINNNPFLLNPFLNPFANPFNTPFAVNPFFPGPVIGNPGFVGPQPIVPPVTVPLVRQPGIMMYRGADLQVNPWSGTVVRPLTGTATLADGTTYIRLPNTSSLGGGNGTSDLYFNPQTGTFFNPGSGVVSRGDGPNPFVPYVW